MSIAFRITLIIVSIITLVYMCQKIRQEKLLIEYSIFWTLFAAMLVVISVFPQIADWMSALVGIYSTTNFIFLAMIFILVVKCFKLTMDISKMQHKVDELVQKIAVEEYETLNEKKLEVMENQNDSSQKEVSGS